MGGLTVGSVSVGRACQRAGFPLGYVGGEAGRPGTPTTDKTRRAFLWGWSPLEGFTLDWCWFSFCFLFPVFHRGLSTLPRALLRHLQPEGKGQMLLLTKGSWGKGVREKRAHLSQLFPLQLFDEYHNDYLSSYPCSLHSLSLRLVFPWENPLLPEFLNCNVFCSDFSSSPNSLPLLLVGITQNLFRTAVTFSCFPWLWFHSFYIYFWPNNAFTWLEIKWYKRMCNVKSSFHLFLPVLHCEPVLSISYISSRDAFPCIQISS